MSFSTFFSNIQETTWYRAFLNPVIDEIGTKGVLLDIGTGSGKLIQILSTEKGIQCIGVDTNSDMLAEAEKKLVHTNAKLIKTEPDSKLPFENDTFDYITICNVLFHLQPESIDKMLDDCRQLLKKDGKIIVLTPTGQGNILKLTKHYFTLKNKSVYIWYRSTKKRAKIWTNTKYLKHYTEKNQLYYQSKVVMKGFAQLEVIE